MATTPVQEPLRKDVAVKLGLKIRPQKNLCHYTSQTGLIGILESKNLYATNATYLNDSQEVAYAVALAKKYIQTKPYPQGTRAQKNMLNVLDQTETLAAELPVYVASFSEEPDLLSQWRGYCPSHSGFAVCVSPEKMIRLAEQHHWMLFKCVYDEEEQIEILKKMEVHAEAYSAEHQPIPPEIAFGQTILDFASALKHPKFKEESEWRAVRKFSGAATVRVGPSTLVPYIDFPLTVDPQENIDLCCACCRSDSTCLTCEEGGPNTFAPHKHDLSQARLFRDTLPKLVVRAENLC